MDQHKRDVLNRLATIEGHLKSVRRMVEDDRYCVDILRQTYAVERALQKAEAAILQNHLRTCVPAAVRDGREQEITDELFELFELSRK
ncbi:MAG: metal-sensitive transcriptional regulator [Chloroflexi bacterium]|nr:metal-sensitive transcriptional regulator [Chloroflexota bacterium]